MNKTLVTGSDGLLGFALKQLNVNNTSFLSRKDVDLVDFHATSNKFADIKPTNVIHLAAQVGGIGGNLKHSGEYFRNNILMNTNVLESARLANVRKLISFMSTCVFPDKCNYPLNEKDIHNGPPHPSNFGYAYAKRMLEVQSSAYRKEWECNYIVAIPTNIYGPNDNFHLLEGHVIPSLIHKIFIAKQNKTDLTVWGSGKPLREFVFSGDIARLIIWALENYNEDSPIIFTSGNEISIQELVESITRIMEFKGNIFFDESKPDGQYRKPSDTTKLKKYLPEFQWTPLEDGLAKTCEWFQNNFQQLRK